MAASTLSIHSRQRAAGGQVGELDVEDVLAFPSAAARARRSQAVQPERGPAL